MRLRRRLTLLGLVALPAALALPAAVRADGTLPPQPYRYLHPPPALAANNTPPAGGLTSIRVVRGRSQAGYLFSQDTQAGLILPAGALVTPPSVTSVRLQISPVETPSGLPQHFAAEGTAYSVTLSGEPGNTPVRLVHRPHITLRWPHVPLAIYVYAGGKWTQVCYSDNATFTPSTISCTTATVGIFTAVTNPALTGVTTPAPTSRFAWLNRFIPLIVVAAVALLVALVALLTMWPRRRPRGER